MKINLKLIIVTYMLFSINIFSQTSEKALKLISFTPKTNEYNIYYPSNYSLIENDENIVSISNTENGLNITISSYKVEKKIEDIDLIEILNGFLKEIKKTDWKSYKSKFDNLIEGRIEEVNKNWIWWGISFKNKIVLISIDKNEKINDDEVNLLRFIIENLDIY